MANGKVGISYDLGLHSSQRDRPSIRRLYCLCLAMSAEGHENIAHRPRQATTVFCQGKGKGREGKGGEGEGNAHLHYAMRYSTCRSVIRQLHIAVVFIGIGLIPSFFKCRIAREKIFAKIRFGA